MSQSILQQQLFEAGVHFGHQRKKWNPKMLPYIYAERKGIHLIDINQTASKLEEVAALLKSITKSGKTILFVATKKQAKSVVAEAAQKLGMPFVTERWLGGMLTNFSTIKKSIKKMHNIEKLLGDGTLDSITKKERLQLDRTKEKIAKVLGGVSQMGRLPAAVFLVDIGHEHLALAEAKRLGITTIGLVDTNCNPNTVDFPIPANDDSTKSVSCIMNYLSQAIAEGIEERKADKLKLDEEKQKEDDDKDKLASKLLADEDAIKTQLPKQVAEKVFKQKGEGKAPSMGRRGSGGGRK